MFFKTIYWLGIDKIIAERAPAMVIRLVRQLVVETVSSKNIQLFI